MSQLRLDAEKIISAALEKSRPDSTVAHGIARMPGYSGRLILIAMGKAAWQMANAAYQAGLRPDRALVITKYGHLGAPIEGFEMLEAGHPIPDAASVAAASRALELTEGLSGDDLVLCLISGGASALFEAPTVSLEELADVTGQLLACGADITEINTVRKRLSQVKGGKFAKHCAPARVHSIILSDVLGDVPDMIASGPCCADPSSAAQALAIAKKYGLSLSERVWELLGIETPKALENSSFIVSGSVKQLCAAAMEQCEALGYDCVFLTDRLSCQAAEAGQFLAAIAASHCGQGRKLAFVAGGETVVKLRGKGLGGRNQELALSAALKIAGLEDVLVFSLGSDGTDGPTDAAGGIVTGESAAMMSAAGIDPAAALEDNDSYHALQCCGGLIVTGPTGTNVNDLCCLLIGG